MTETASQTTITDELRDQLLDFWFGPIGADGSVGADRQSRWWTKSSEFDALCCERFEQALQQARAGEITAPQADVRGSLAYIILCDQLSRNMHRGTPDSFASDNLALDATLHLIEAGTLAQLQPVERSFALMPLMHSEELSIQEISVEQFALLKSLGKDNLDFAVRHKAIIDRFGRYPHRNAILGRESTEEEAQFLTQPGSSF